MRILGIDPGLARVGYGLVITEPMIHAQDYGVITTPSHQALAQRLVMLYGDVQTLLAQCQPDQVVIEKLFFYRMANTIIVAQARGVILLCLGQWGGPVIEYSPPQIKQALTGHGRATKLEMQAAVQRELGFEKLPQPDDAADGLALALTGWFFRHNSEL